MIEYIKENMDFYNNKIENMKRKENEEIYSQSYGLHVLLNYESLVNYFETIKAKLNI